jgi:hypothetical protein
MYTLNLRKERIFVGFCALCAKSGMAHVQQLHRNAIQLRLNGVLRESSVGRDRAEN